MKAITDNTSTMDVPGESPPSTENTKMKSPIDLLIEAQNNQLQVVASHRLAVLKSQDDLKKFRGEDDYQIAVSTIVKEYPEGIVLTRLREVLPDSVILDNAVKALVEKKEITTESYGKRTQLLKPMAQAPVQPPSGKVESVDTNPTGDPKWQGKSSGQTANPGTPVQDITEE